MTVGYKVIYRKVLQAVYQKLNRIALMTLTLCLKFQFTEEQEENRPSIMSKSSKTKAYI